MSLTSTSTLTVTDQTPASASTTIVIQPPSTVTASARGRLVHPTLGTYDYVNTPDETVNIDGGPLYRPIWSHTPTIGGAADALWSGFLRDARVVERWIQGDVGSPIAHLRTLWSFFANAPDPSADSFVLWTPNYTGSTQAYKVALVDVRAGGGEYTIDMRLLSKGYAPQPVELEMRVIGLES